MDGLEKQIQKATKNIRMRVSDKRTMREDLVAYMEYHPLSEASRRASQSKRAVSGYVEDFFTLHIQSWQARSFMGAVAIFILIVVPVSAEYTVPGDVLYPVKVRVTEEVRSQLSFSSFDKVAWQTRRVERRIAEARLLAKEGKLTEEKEIQITATVKEHTASAKRELAELRETDADEAAVAQVALQSAFEVQSAVLDTDHSSSTEGEGQIRALATAVKDVQATIMTDPDPNPSSVSSYQRFIAEVEESTTRARDLFASIQASATEEERADIQRRIDDIDRSVNDARTLYEASSTGEAIQGLKDTLGNTQKLISFMTDIDVHEAVALETLVPKQLTDEERRTAVESGRTETEQSLLLLSHRVASSTDDALIAKVTEGVLEIKKDLLLVEAGLAEGGSFEDAENAQAQAEALVHDLNSLFEPLDEINIDASHTPAVMGTTTTSTTTSTGTSSHEIVASE